MTNPNNSINYFLFSKLKFWNRWSIYTGKMAPVAGQVSELGAFNVIIYVTGRLYVDSLMVRSEKMCM